MRNFRFETKPRQILSRQPIDLIWVTVELECRFGPTCGFLLSRWWAALSRTLSELDLPPLLCYGETSERLPRRSLGVGGLGVFCSQLSTMNFSPASLVTGHSS